MPLPKNSTLLANNLINHSTTKIGIEMTAVKKKKDYDVYDMSLWDSSSQLILEFVSVLTLFRALADVIISPD